jgi:hypothetical protein
MGLIRESEVGRDHRQTITSRRDFIDRSTKALHGEKSLRGAARRCSHSPLQGSDRSTDTVRQIADATARRLQEFATRDRAVTSLPRMREQGPIDRFEDVEAGRALRHDARQRIATREDRRIVDSRSPRPIRFEFDADDPAEERPSFPSIFEARLLEDHFAAQMAFTEYEGKLLERGSERHAAFGQLAQVLQDVDRVHEGGLILARRELCVERGTGEDVLATFSRRGQPRSQVWIYRWQSRTHTDAGAGFLDDDLITLLYFDSKCLFTATPRLLGARTMR